MRRPEVAVPPGSAERLIAPDLTLDAAAARLRDLLRDVGGGDAAYDARVLLEEATGLDRAALLRLGERQLGDAPAAILDGWLARRLRGEPLWRVLGTREFWGLPFALTPAVLDPRPDTETVVEAVLAAMNARGDSLRILDLGVGSGAILGALLHSLPQARGWGVDLSLAACGVAAANLTALGLAGRAQIVNGHWADALATSADAAGALFDVVVSNPPYIATATIPTLHAAVRDYDPLMSLDGGPDGLKAYRAIAAVLPGLLRPRGVAAMEVGFGQAEIVCRLLRRAGLDRCATRRDLAGIERVVVVTR